MTLTYGFYNSSNGDRTYDAIQFSQIFDGIISDGVIEDVLNEFYLGLVGIGIMQVTVDTGRAWFDHSWTLNDSPLVLSLDPSEPVLDRLDTIVLETNRDIAVRANSIKVVKGTPGPYPAQPATLTWTENIHQYSLGKVYITGGATTPGPFTQDVGTVNCPYATLATPDIQRQINEIITTHSTDVNAIVGNHTVDDEEQPYDDTETLYNLLSNISCILKRITGKTHWYTNPAITLETLNAGVNSIKFPKRKGGSGGTNENWGLESIPNDLVRNVVQRVRMYGGCYKWEGTAASSGSIVIDLPDSLPANGLAFVTGDSNQAKILYSASCGTTGIVVDWRTYDDSTVTFHRFNWLVVGPDSL